MAYPSVRCTKEPVPDAAPALVGERLEVMGRVADALLAEGGRRPGDDASVLSRGYRDPEP